MTLTAERARELFAYDPDTGVVTYRQGKRAGQPCGHWRPDGYLAARTSNTTIYMHRLAWLLTYGQWPAEQIDHINRNRSDNRLANLREATQALNNANARKKCASSGFRGVVSHPNRFRAEVYRNRKVFRGPYRINAVEAAADYDRMAVEHHGEFATTNESLGLLPPTSSGEAAA